MFDIRNISHACLKYQVDDVVLLTDPWIVDEPIKSNVIYKFPPQHASTLEACESVTHVYISHTHEDHFHIPSILNLPRSIKLIVSDYDFAPHQCERNLVLLKTLKNLGFTNIQVLKPWQWVELSSRMRVCLIPSAESRHMDWENSGLAVEVDGHLSLNMNDNIVDDQLCNEISEFFGTVHMYFIQTAGLSTFPACFDMTDEEKQNALRSKTNNFSLHDRVVKLVNPEYLIPYAGDFGWFGEFEDLTFNSRLTPLPLLDHLAELESVKTSLFEPGDVITIKNRNPEFHRINTIDWDDPRKFYETVKRRYEPLFSEIDARWTDSKVIDYQEHVRAYFEDVSEWHRNEGPVVDFQSQLVYRIYDDHDEVFYLVSATPGQPLSITQISEVQESVPQIHNIALKYFIPVLTGQYMMSEIQWRTKITQRVKSENSVLLIFFINYYFDKANRTPQLLLNDIYRIAS